MHIYECRHTCVGTEAHEDLQVKVETHLKDINFHFRRDNSLTKMEPSKEFGSFSALLAPALLANKSSTTTTSISNNKNNTVEETTTTTTKRTTTETKKEEMFSNNRNRDATSADRGMFSTTITTPVKEKAKEASFLLSEVTTKAPQPFRISEDSSNKKESSSSLFSSNLVKKDSSSKLYRGKTESFEMENQE